MADKRISELAALDTPTAADEIPVVQAGTTYRMTRQQMHTLESGETFVGNLTGDVTGAVEGAVTDGGGMVHNVLHSDYGAVGDGATDDSAAIQAAVDAAIAAGGGIVFFPPGKTYVCSSKITIANLTVGLTLLGAGWDAGGKIQCGDNGFLEVTTTAEGLTIDGLYITSNHATNTQNGVEIEIPNRCRIVRCFFEGFGGNSLLLEGGVHTVVDQCVFDAANSSGTGEAGIKCIKDPNTNVGTTIDIRHCYVFNGGDYGILCDQSPTLSTFTNVIIESVNDGLRLDTVGQNTIINPYFENVTANNIELDDASRTVIIGGNGGAPNVSWTGVAFNLREIVVIEGVESRLGGNLLLGEGADISDAEIAIAIENAQTAPTTNPTGGVLLYSESGTLKCRNTAGVIALAESAVNSISDADATPDVAGKRVLKTENTGATTITGFDNGIAGQEITVIFGDGNTTVDFTGTNLKGNAGVDWSPASGDHMTCVYDGTNWYCDISDNTV